jgi:hypothetical protein
MVRISAWWCGCTASIFPWMLQGSWELSLAYRLWYGMGKLDDREGVLRALRHTNLLKPEEALGLDVGVVTLLL